MNLEIFKPTKKLREDLKVSGLKAKMRNSALPGVASRYLRFGTEDPWCNIYVRGHDPKVISSWQRTNLEGLFDQGGLARAIEEGLNDYLRELDMPGKPWSHVTEESFGEIQEFGIAACVSVREIIIDEIQQEVILSCYTEVDGNLTEHGIAIHRTRASWKYDESDYLINYEERVEAEGQVEFNDRWEKLFPLPEAPVTSNTVTDWVVGEWVFDSAASEKMLKQLRSRRKTMEVLLLQSTGTSWKVDGGRIEVVLPQFGIQAAGVILGCERLGNRLALRAASQDTAVASKIAAMMLGSYFKGTPTEQDKTFAPEFGILDDCLVDRQGRVFRRTTNKGTHLP